MAEKPTFAPAYVGLFPILSELAQEYGYALTVHGSVSRDFDLVAIPWTESAVDPRYLVESIITRIRENSLFPMSIEEIMGGVEMKPHRRVAYTIPIDAGAAIDLSVVCSIVT